MKLNRRISFIILTVVVIISTIIGFKSLYPATPNYDDESKTTVTNQMNHIYEIAKEPHSIFDIEAKGKVRDYLVSELQNLGLEASIYEYEDVYVEYTDSHEDLQNIYAELKGKSDSYIMLVTHYDTARAKRYAEKDGSVGAADAGYGLSTILETLRVIKESGQELENGIKILFTDGEEYGLLGAKEAVSEPEIFEGVNYLINLEARGTKGPAIMFETSPNNAGILDLYEVSTHPFSYSITPEIYRLLPNGTDFTIFLENNIPGINIAVLDGLEHYHTPDDNPENLNKASMQHYGDQVLPIVKEFVYNAKYSNPEALQTKDDAIFFTFANIFIKYSKTVNYVLIATILLAIIFLFKKLKIQKLRHVFKYTLINTGYTITMMGLAYLLTRVVAMLNGREFNFTYLPLMKFEDVIFIVTIILTLIGYVLAMSKVTRQFKEKNEFVLGSIMFLLILGTIITFTLPGASYLMVVPAFLMSIGLVIKELVQSDYMSFSMLVPIVFILILFVPTIYLFNAALTFGGLTANMLFIMIGFITIISSAICIKGITK